MTQLVNDQVRTLHLCPGCAEELGVNVDTGEMDMGQILGELRRKMKALGLNPDGHEEMEHDKKKDKAMPSAPVACPLCGMTRKEAEEEGRPGCPQCYEAFPDVFLPENPDGGPRYSGPMTKEYRKARPGVSTSAAPKTKPSVPPMEEVGPSDPPAPPPSAAEEPVDTTQSIHRLRRELTMRQRQMARAIHEERYEDAATLRDQCRSLLAELARMNSDSETDGDRGPTT